MPNGADRWRSVLATVGSLLPGPAAAVVVDGEPALAAMFAGRLADAIGADGVTVAVGPQWMTSPDVVVRVRADRSDARADGEREPDVVVDLHDPAWPLIRHVNPALDRRRRWYPAETMAFFGVRAATWDTRFGDEAATYASAVGEAGFATGGTVLDIGCGTGRALPAIRAVVGPAGTAVGLDLTPQMLAVARASGRDAHAALVLGDARHLPVADGVADGIFAAGLVMHLPDIGAGLTELARITRPAGRLALFHPTGRAALAARHGRALRPDDPLTQALLTQLLADAGWRLEHYDDASHRFFAVAARTPA